MSRWKISMHVCGDLLTNEEKISYTLTNPIPQRIHHWPLKRKNGVLLFYSDWFLMSNLLLGCKRQLLHKKYTHFVYDFWTMFSQKKISPISLPPENRWFWEPHSCTLQPSSGLLLPWRRSQSHSPERPKHRKTNTLVRLLPKIPKLILSITKC